MCSIYRSLDARLFCSVFVFSLNYQPCKPMLGPESEAGSSPAHAAAVAASVMGFLCAKFCPICFPLVYAIPLFLDHAISYNCVTLLP